MNDDYIKAQIEQLELISCRLHDNLDRLDAEIKKLNKAFHHRDLSKRLRARHPGKSWQTIDEQAPITDPVQVAYKRLKMGGIYETFDGPADALVQMEEYIFELKSKLEDPESWQTPDVDQSAYQAGDGWEGIP